MFVSKSKSKLEEYIQKKNTISFYILLSLTNEVVCQEILFFHQRNRSGTWMLDFCLHIVIVLMAMAPFLVNLYVLMSFN